MKPAALCLLLIILSVSTGFAQENADEQESTGFGNQAIRIDTNVSNATLIKKVLGSTRYKLTPGDTYELVIKLDATERVTLILPSDYKLELPYLGTYDARDQYFSEFRSRLIRDIKKRLPVAEYVDFVLTSPALFDVMIHGGVKTPGAVTVTPLNTVWEALAAAGGPKPGGSIRGIRLYRGQEAFTCDLSLYTQKADVSQNPLLQPGDRIYVPHAEIVVKATGALLYPDAYEMIPGETLQDLVWMAGGLRPDAVNNDIEVTRIEDGTPQLLQTTAADAGGLVLRNGDIVYIPSVVEVQDTILLEAAVYGKPAEPDKPRVILDRPVVLEIPYAPGLSVLSLLDSLGGPTPLAAVEESVIYRGEEREEIHFDAGKLWKSRDPALDRMLQPGDHLFIPMKKLAVVVAGEVHDPGAYPYLTGGQVYDYIGLAGGAIPETASLKRIFLVDEGGQRELATLTSPVPPASTIYVDKNAWKRTTYTLDETGIVIGFASSLIALLTAIMQLISLF